MVNSLQKIQILGVLAVMLCAGCSGTCRPHGFGDKLLDRYFQEREAARAWKRVGHCWLDDPYLPDFREGFLDGYIAMMNGADGCPPTLPPKCYWDVKNRDCSYPERVSSWYDGYMTGTTQALSDGVQNRNRIITSYDLYGYGKPCQQPVYEWPDCKDEPIPTEYHGTIDHSPASDIHIPPAEYNPPPTGGELMPPAPMEDMPPAPMNEPLQSAEGDLELLSPTLPPLERY